jgi:hypothetical protein
LYYDSGSDVDVLDCDENVQSPINSGDKEDETVIDARAKNTPTKELLEVEN